MDQAIYGTLNEVFADVFMRDDLTLSPDLSAAQVKGWDSFKQIELIMACEERFAVKLRTREIDALRTVGDLAALLESKIKAKA